MVGKPFPCHIQMQNPTTVFLTKATWFIEGPGLQMPMEIPFGFVSKFACNLFNTVILNSCLKY